MPLFKFSAPSELASVVNYLVGFDPVVRLQLRCGHDGTLEGGAAVPTQRLSLSTMKVPPTCFPQAEFTNVLRGSPGTVLMQPVRFFTDRDKTLSRAVSADRLLAVLRGLHNDEPFALEFVEDSPSLRLYQHKPEQYTHVLQVDGLYDLGGQVEVDCGSLSFSNIEDAAGLGHLLRSLSICGDGFATISIEVGEACGSLSPASLLTVRSETVCGQLKISNSDCSNEPPHECVSARIYCPDATKFAQLVSERRAVGTAVGIGFGDEGLSALRLDCPTMFGTRRVLLFFCSEE